MRVLARSVPVLAVALLLPGAGGVLTDAAPRPLVVPSAPPLHRPYTESLGRKVKFRMVAIPGGTFLMGSSAAEPGHSADEGPRHRVSVGPFWMGQTEVTWDEYDLFRGKGVPADEKSEVAAAINADAITRPSPPYPNEYREFGKEGYPVVGISHHAAMEYCRWLSRRTGKGYRLPTEAEWEWACRAGTRTPWFCGEKASRLDAYAWYDKNANDRTHPVGKKKPNPWGLYDVHGNVAEWCLDHYNKDDYSAFTPGTLAVSPVRLPTAFRFSHVVRGGSWADSADRCRSAARRGSHPSWNKIDPARHKSIWWLWDADFVGFRVVRAVTEQDNLKGIRSRVTKLSK
jgi:formylglycine-generating enzyme required for sulfatase activity